MDPVTHVAGGILVGQAVCHRFPPGNGSSFYGPGAWILTGQCRDLPGAQAYMRYHRA
jgi:hypothetical protein